jgi:hypothetical protein
MLGIATETGEIRYISDGFSSLSRKRYILDHLIFVGAVEVGIEGKKLEKILYLSERARKILNATLSLGDRCDS